MEKDRLEGVGVGGEEMNSVRSLSEIRIESLDSCEESQMGDNRHLTNE